MALVKIEAEEEGDGDSNCSADKAGELFSSVLELACDRCEIVILEGDNDILCDSPHNMIEVKRGLAPEVKVSSPPADWVPDCVKRECTEPASFLVIDNPGGWDNTLSVLNSTTRQKERTSRRGNILIMQYLLVQDQFLWTKKEKGRRLDGTSITKDCQIPRIRNLEAVHHTKIPFLIAKREILTLIYSNIWL
jgi:hypothetical protein